MYLDYDILICTKLSPNIIFIKFDPTSLFREIYPQRRDVFSMMGSIHLYYFLKYHSYILYINL